MQFIMKKILVPVDFSGASDWGFNYACHLAFHFGAELFVVHLYRPPYVESQMPPAMIKQIRSEKEQNILSHLRLSTQTPIRIQSDDKSMNVKINYILESAAETDLSDVAKAYGTDLIVMGTHGAGNAAEKIWGTNTAKVIQNSNCPVLAIPVGANFETIHHIAYATDYDPSDIDNVTQLVLFATALNAKVHCIHINNILDDIDEDKEKAFKILFEERFKNLPVSFSVRSSTSVEEGLETFLRINQISILSMLTHKRNLWNRIFGEKSITKSMAFRTKLPLLAFHT